MVKWRPHNGQEQGKKHKILLADITVIITIVIVLVESRQTYTALNYLYDVWMHLVFCIF